MKTVFADAVYWIAIVKPRDQWRDAALAAKEQIKPARIVTTDEVLGEFLAALREGGPTLRSKAVEMVKAILSNANVRVGPRWRESFLKGLALYGARGDKHYSLQDCISMNVMKSESIAEVLTKDHHFEQEGFTILMPREHP